MYFAHAFVMVNLEFYFGLVILLLSHLNCIW